MTRVRPLHVLACTLLLGLIAAAVVFVPLLLPVWRAQAYEHRAGPPELQRIIEEGMHGDEARALAARRDVFPYDSISLDSGACFGPCPVYVLTLYRDGRAHLVTNDVRTSRPGRRTYVGRISANDYARVTQMVFLARAAARESSYAGNWTDDAKMVVQANGSGVDWKVSDYGGVSPPEVWSLILVLSSFREGIEWQEESAAPR
ncbi:MAG: hypothetical protein JNM58_09405 [Xanthomonadaceae bacterium]|nr:hypothetical protein [Xanthomonadaceae bacterium]